MKKFLFLAQSFLLTATLLAQSNVHYHNGQPCLYDHAVEHVIQQNEYYRQATAETFRQAQILGAQQRGLRSTIEIPVVVHVVYKTTAERIDISKVQEQIDVLNEDYQRLNADTSNLRPIFNTVAASPNITFRLDSVIYKETNTNFYSSGFLPDMEVTNKVKFDCEGGDEAWDVSKYLNIWICNLGNSGVLGFAYPPADLSNWPAGSAAPTIGQEGVVFDYRVVGRSGVYSVQGTNIITQGRTATHEVGHYLGLRHIWGDGTLSIFGMPDCSVDDGIADTPNQGMNANFTCDKTLNTCEANAANDLPDMIENFMDYASEDCMNTFTQGQVDVMVGVLSPNGYRSSLSTNTTFHRAPSYDKQSAAMPVSISDENCNNIVQASNQYAHPSYKIGQCHGNDYKNGDVWFSFVAPSTAVELSINNSTAMEGNNTDIVFELINTSCATSAGTCFTSFPASLSGLQEGNTYYLRAYSADSSSRQDFSFCLKSTGIVSINQLQNIHWNVFPNPNNGHFSVQLPNNLANKASINIINTLGQIITKYTVLEGDNLIQISLQNQAAGIYTIQLITEEGFSTRTIQVKP